jgi:hypothetical protein
MITFNATIEMPTGTYYIDKKPAVNGIEWFAITYNSNAVYLNSVLECLEWIESHNDYILKQAA